MPNCDDKILKQLIDKYLDGNASDEEIQALEAYYSLFSDGPDALNSLQDEQLERLKLKLKSQIDTQVELSLDAENDTPVFTIYRHWRKMTGVAVAVILCFFGFWLYQHNNQVPTNLLVQVIESEVVPGGNKAILILADGRKVDLREDQSGILVGADAIVYADGVSVENDAANARGEDDRPSELALSTPNGGQYQVTLPDGTRVWLNAASTIKYPMRFSGSVRRVHLLGEAYFEVSKNVDQPFVVESNGHEVMVIGTHFNINAYGDEEVVRTTLLEGAVRVKSTIKPYEDRSVVLKPGQQSVVKVGEIEVKNIEVEAVMDWKEGYFKFNDENLGSIMRKVARWYDVEVHFEDEHLKKELFAGMIDRFNNIGELLQTLEMTDRVSFQIKGKVISVSKKKK